MAVIAFVNPKGGSGKTTLSLVLAEQFASRGQSVCLIDTDPNGFHKSWLVGRDKDFGKAPFEILHVVKEDDIVEALDKAAQEFDTVLVDTEGTANLSITRVLSRTHLVIIPMNTSQMDAEQAARAVQLLQKDSAMFTRQIEFRLVFSRTSAGFQNATQKALGDELRAGGLPVLTAHLNERRAFRDLFSFNRTVRELIQGLTDVKALNEAEGSKAEVRKAQALIDGYEKAFANAETVVDELEQVLQEMIEKAA